MAGLAADVVAASEVTSVIFATSIGLLDPSFLVRVEDPEHPEALATTATHAVLAEAPTDGTAWRYEAIGYPDSEAVEAGTSTIAVEVSNADLWHADGITGAGVRVAVFDTGWFAPEHDIDRLGEFESADCWSAPGCEDPIDVLRPRLNFEDGAHGLSCAEIVRDIAPGAELFLVRTNTLAAVQNAVEWSIRNDIDIITMSMSFFNDSFYDGGRGPWDDLLHRVEAHDILFVTSSGNNARAHWSGAWLDVDADHHLDFDGSNGLAVELPAGSSSFFVNWNQHGRCGDTDLSARVEGPNGMVHGFINEPQLASDPTHCQPFERLNVKTDEEGIYTLKVRQKQGRSVGLELDILGRGGALMVQTQRERSLGDPAAHPLAFAVGAVRASDYLTANPESFSSRGPNHAGWPKPDIAGPDGLSTASAGPLSFYGTSGSSPAVAGMIALIMQDNPELTPRDAARKLQGWAWQMDPEWDDPRWGAGKARLPVRGARSWGCVESHGLAGVLLVPLCLLRRRRQ